MPSKRDWEAGPGKRVSACEKFIDDRYFHTISNLKYSLVFEINSNFTVLKSCLQAQNPMKSKITDHLVYLDVSFGRL